MDELPDHGGVDDPAEDAEDAARVEQFLVEGEPLVLAQLIAVSLLEPSNEDRCVLPAL